jgi:CBS domain-containing protein
MTPDVCTPDDTLKDAAEALADVKILFEDQDLEDVTAKMGDIQVRRLPVLNRQKRLVGIIALGDIAQVQASDGPAQRSARYQGPVVGMPRREPSPARPADR